MLHGTTSTSIYFHTLCSSNPGKAEKTPHNKNKPKKGHLKEMIAILSIQQNIGFPCSILQPQLGCIPPTDAAACLGVCIPAHCLHTRLSVKSMGGSCHFADVSAYCLHVLLKDLQSWRSRIVKEPPGSPCQANFIIEHRWVVDNPG